MTSAHQPGTRDPSRGWIPPIPSPLQRLFASVPLVTYPANELPGRSPAPAGGDLPTLHVFISDEDAARGLPSFNPSCLKWQAYLRLASVPHNLRSSTNHASPTGSLPFLQPALPSAPEHRLDARHLLPVPSSRLDSYARQHGSPPSSQLLPPPPPPPPPPTDPDARHRRQQAYQSLLDTAVRSAWLYALYLAPANEPVLRRLYVDPASRSALVRRSLLAQLRAAARAEIARASGAGVTTTATTTTTTTTGGLSLSLAGLGGGDLLTWALGGRPSVDPAKVYDDARRAFGALEAVLSDGAETTAAPPGQGQQEEDEDEDEDEAAAAAAARGPWFFGAPAPTLFDAAVFSYTHLILHGAHTPAAPAWGDDTLRRIVRDGCPRLVAHARGVLALGWGPAAPGGLSPEA